MLDGLFGIVLFGALIAGGARDRAAQAGPLIRLCARLILAYCYQPHEASLSKRAGCRDRFVAG